VHPGVERRPEFGGVLPGDRFKVRVPLDVVDANGEPAAGDLAGDAAADR
jgi:hypothetical protein